MKTYAEIKNVLDAAYADGTNQPLIDQLEAELTTLTPRNADMREEAVARLRAAVEQLRFSGRGAATLVNLKRFIKSGDNCIASLDYKNWAAVFTILELYRDGWQQIVDEETRRK